MSTLRRRHRWGLLALLLSIAVGPLLAVPPIETPLESQLSGQSFRGEIRAAGLLGLFGRQGRLAFRDGLLDWTVDDTAQEYPPAPYTVRAVGQTVEFSATMTGVHGDRVDWRGVFDGRALSQVTAVWTRQPGDFLHDLLLPAVVTLHFTPAGDTDTAARQ